MNDEELDQALRSLGRRHVRQAAPPSLHELAMVVPSSTTERRRWLLAPTRTFQSMFGAARFVAAGVVVALFGGTLLTGLPDQPTEDQPPAIGASSTHTAEATPERTGSSTRSAIVPGVDLRTVEIEPGVFHVMSDGVRDLAITYPTGNEGDPRHVHGHAVVVEAAADGSIWAFGPHLDGFYRLGDEATFALPTEPILIGEDIEVGPDGRIWWAMASRPGTLGPGNRLRVFEDQRWETEPGLSAGHVEIGPDGTVWHLARGALRQLADESWTDSGLGLPGLYEAIWEGGREADPSFDASFTPAWAARDAEGYYDFTVTDDGTAWLTGVGWPELWRSRDGGWEQVGMDWLPLEPHEYGAGKRQLIADTGPSGVTWVHTGDPTGQDQLLGRFDGAEWETWSVGDGIPTAVDGGLATFRRLFEVSADGSLWLAPASGPREDGSSCDGVARFDGVAWADYLVDRCVADIEIGPDGAAWVLAGTRGEPGPARLEETAPFELYVIPEPEARIDMRPDEDSAQAQASAPTPREEEMRLQTPMATALAIATMAAAPAVAAAQADDGAAEEWTYLTWTLDDGAAAYSYGSFGSGRGTGLVLEASDPRASGVLDLQYNATDGGAEDQPIALWEFQLQLANDEGAWSGTGSSVVTLEDGSDDAETSIEPWRLQGSGAYEGLTLVMVTTNRESDEERWGFIVPTAEVPQVPDPVRTE